MPYHEVVDLRICICVCVFVFAFVFVFAGYNKQSSIVPDRGGHRLLLYRSFFNCTLSLPQVITFLGQRRSLREAQKKTGKFGTFTMNLPEIFGKTRSKKCHKNNDL